MFVDNQELSSLIKDNVDYESEFGKSAIEKGFCFNGSLQAFSDELMFKMRDSKRYLFSPTSLHIFVVTNECNMKCVYCQAQSGSSKIEMMTNETAEKAVDIALSSPAEELSFEFQGGEPLLNFGVIKHIVEYTQATKANKRISFSLVSNLTLLSKEIIEFLLKNDISVSTSLDGHEALHNLNRPMKTGVGSYFGVINGIERLKNAGIIVGAIETTTKMALGSAERIVDAYVNAGFDSIFIRPLTQIGRARDNWNEIGYSAKDFVAFYRNCINYIIHLNRKGIKFKEGHLSLVLPKILHGQAVNYMELRSPCGAGIGQMAYYYDGNVYTCDEGRMLAEMGNDAFKLGNVYLNTYDDMIDSTNCKAACLSSCLESLPLCESCVYSPYCGVCPVANYVQRGNVFCSEPNNYRCEIYKGIFDTVFELIKDDACLEIIKEWV